MKNYLHLSLIFFFLVSIGYLSLSPISGPETGLPISDIGHLLLYFSLSGAFLLYFHDKNHDHIDAVILAGLTGLIFEILQSQLSYRTFADTDILVNFIGASVILLEQKISVIHRILVWEENLLEKLLN